MSTTPSKPEDTQLPTPGKIHLAGASSNFFLDWIATLSTVFLSGAALSLIMRYCSGGYTWDGGAAIFSTVLAWLSYRLTLSDKCLPNLRQRLALAVGMPIFWGLFLPLVLWGLGFK